MARRLTIAVALVALLCLCSFAVGADLTEADFKKMKAKQLKQFLAERGVACETCEEKPELVAECVKHASKPVTNGKQKVVVPDGTLWEVWANQAFEVCEATAATKKASDEAKATVCNNIKSATDSVFMQHGKRTAQKLKKKPDALLKTSFGEIYLGAGKKMLTKLAAFCFKNAAKCRSSSSVQAIMEKDDSAKGVKFITYLTNVGIENTNPMYETLKDKNLDKDEL